jgi:unsaturated pyranuronate lyase
MTAFKTLAQLEPITLAPGITARSVEGERMTVAVVDLAPNAVSPEHAHENEQIGFVIRGSMTMRIGNEVLELHPGDTYVIPSHIEHGAAAGPEGASVTDIFVPIREDWKGKDRLEPSTPDWP